MESLLWLFSMSWQSQGYMAGSCICNPTKDPTLMCTRLILESSKCLDRTIIKATKLLMRRLCFGSFCFMSQFSISYWSKSLVATFSPASYIHTRTQSFQNLLIGKATWNLEVNLHITLTLLCILWDVKQALQGEVIQVFQMEMTQHRFRRLKERATPQ